LCFLCKRNPGILLCAPRRSSRSAASWMQYWRRNGTTSVLRVYVALRRSAHKRACIGLIAEVDVDVLTDACLDNEYNAHQAGKEYPRMPLYSIRSLPNSIRDTECRPLRRKEIKSSVRLVSRAMTTEGCLALALMFLSSEAEVKLLGVLFGLQEQRACAERSTSR
jgi:hypothetical protein